MMGPAQPPGPQPRSTALRRRGGRRPAEGAGACPPYARATATENAEPERITPRPQPLAPSPHGAIRPGDSTLWVARFAAARNLAIGATELEGPTAVSPAVSIIMVCHNGSRFLGEALDSVRAQSFGDWELVFWDNGSTDGSAAIARGYDPRVRPCGGPCRLATDRARNQAIRLSRGRYLAFLDADDLWRPDKLERQVTRMAQGDVGLVFSDCRIITADGRVLGRYFQRTTPARGRAFEALLDENFIPFATVLADRAVILEAGGFDPTLRVAADYDLWLRLARLRPIDYEAEPLASYRIHEANLTGDFRAAYRENVRVYRRCLRNPGLQDPNLQRRLRRALASLYWKWAARELLLERRPARALARFRTGWARAGSTGQALRHLGWFLHRHLRGAQVRCAMHRSRRR